MEIPESWLDQMFVCLLMVSAGESVGYHGIDLRQQRRNGIRGIPFKEEHEFSIS